MELGSAWINEFLTGRTLRLVVNLCIKVNTRATSKVPQGTTVLTGTFTILSNYYQHTYVMIIIRIVTVPGQYV